MATVAAPTQKSNRAFYACLLEEPGILTKVGGKILFVRHADGAEIDYTPEMAPRLVVLDECGLVEAQALADLRRGGHAAVCTSRQQEV